MSPAQRNLGGALGLAAVLAFVAIVPQIAGIETWKILLAILGLVLITLAGPASRTRK